MNLNAKALLRATGAAVVIHAGVTIVHGAAHSQLHIELSPWGKVFVAGVIGIGPIAGLFLLWAGHLRKGAAILSMTMAGALLFGLWNHFLADGADHVAHLPAGSWRLPFQITAWLLLATEGAGFAAAAALLRGSARNDERQEV